MQGKKWTYAEDADMFALYPTTKTSELAVILTERHGNNRSTSAVKNRAIKLGVKKAEGHKHPMPKKMWTEDRVEWMRLFVPGHTESEIADAFEERFGIRLNRAQVKNGKAACGVKSGTYGGRFEKGNEPANKGKTWDEQGISVESQAKMRETCFRKGNIPNNAVDKQIGHERIDQDGYTWVKIASRKSHPGCNDNWRPKHHLVWEEAHGCRVPEKTQIVFANKDKADFRPENIVAVPRELWAVIVRCEMDYYDADSLHACMNIAKLKSCIRAVELATRPCRRCGKEFEPRYKNQRTCDTCLGRTESKKGNTEDVA